MTDPATRLTPTQRRLTSVGPGAKTVAIATISAPDWAINAVSRETLGVAVAVLPRADVALGIQRQAAQRARLPTGRHYPLGTADERPRPAGVDPYPQHVRALR